MRANRRAAAEAPPADPSPSSAPAPPVLLLDVDGVLNLRVTTTSSGSSSPLGGVASSASGSAADGFSELHGSLLQRLAGVIRATNARVVLSSTWRLDAASRARLQRRLCVELFAGSTATAPPPPLQMDATPCVSTAELLRFGPLVAVRDTLATQRVVEIRKWIQQQNQVQSTAEDTNNISNSAVTTDGISPSSNSSNPVEISNSVLTTEWVALDDLDLLSAATKLPASVQLAQGDMGRHFVQTDPAKGLSVENCERLVELLGPVSATEAGNGGDLLFQRSSVARAVQQRVDLLFVVDARAHVALSEGPVVVVVDTSTFQVIASLDSLDEARAWVAGNDEVVLFDESLITILEIVANESQQRPTPPSPRDDDEPDPLAWLRRRHHSLITWSQDELQGRAGISSLSLANAVAEQLCQVATTAGSASSSDIPTLQATLEPSSPSQLLMRLLTCLDELEAQEFDAEVAQTRFSQCGFSQQHCALLAGSPRVARHLLHLVPLASSSNSLQWSSSSNSSVKRSRYCELLLAICQHFSGATQSVLRQHLSEYVVRDELTSLAALEAVAFAVEHGDDGAVLSGELDELICCC